MKRSVVEIIQEAFDQALVEVDEFNSVHDTCEKLANENSFLKLQLKTVNDKLAKTVEAANSLKERYDVLDSQSKQVLDNGDKHLSTAKQAYRERDQMTDQLATAKSLLKTYKEIDTPKNIRNKIKTYQTKAAESAVAMTNSKKVIKDLRKENLNYVNHISELMANETQSNMTTIWSENGDHLMLFPAKLSMQVGDHVERQITLLYMTKSGCAKLIGLDEDGIATVCKMPPGGMKPKARTLAVAGEMLRKFKRQDWKLTINDLDLGSM